MKSTICELNTKEIEIINGGFIINPGAIVSAGISAYIAGCKLANELRKAACGECY